MSFLNLVLLPLKKTAKKARLCQAVLFIISYALPCFTQKLGVAVALLRGVALQRENPLVNRVKEPRRLREEGLLQLVARSDPIAGAKHHRSGVKIIKRHLGDIGCQIVKIGTAGAGVTGDDDSAGLLD